MAITFPRAFPDELKVTALEFNPLPMQTHTQLRGGKTIAADLGPTLWQASYASPILKNDEYGVARAWALSLTSLRSFLAYDHKREWPLSYPGGVGLPATTCAIDDVADGAQLELKTMTPGFKLRPGDFLSFQWGAGNAYALHMVTAGGDANGSGNLAVEVAPDIADGWAEDAAVTLVRAVAEMAIVPGTFHASVDARQHFGIVSFEAIQVG